MKTSGRPKVSVVMTFYNGEKYLKEALDSILGQTFRDFEFIIVDDASTDRSAAVVRSVRDPRIRLLRNQTRIGMSASLNLGVRESRGIYIARMDADDLCMPNRLEKEVRWLDETPSCSVVTAHIRIVDEKGKEHTVWWEDLNHADFRSISRQLVRTNCLSHPSVMARAGVLRANPYDPRARAEDYELWLRLVAAGHRIDKIPEVLILHRRHRESLTNIDHSRPGAAVWQLLQAKWVFLRNQRGGFRKPSLFEAKVAWNAASVASRQVAKIVLGPLRRGAESSLFGLGELAARVWPVRVGPGPVLFFPTYQVGGAERVHADICRCLSGKKPAVVFTASSSDQSLLATFRECGRVFRLGFWLGLKVPKPFFLGYWAAVLNRGGADTLGSNSYFYYQLVPHLGPKVTKRDILHMFGEGGETYSLPVAPMLDERIVITTSVREQLGQQYHLKGLASGLSSRIRVIENKVDDLYFRAKRVHGGRLQVLYVGRGGAQKRVHLVGQAAELCAERGLDAEFTLVGPGLEDWIPPAQRGRLRFAGPVHGGGDLEPFYRRAHILILLSAWEGFPLVVMEAMASGVVPICSAVGGIGSHLRSGTTGYLTPAFPEREAVEAAVSAIERLDRDRGKLKALSANCFRHAKGNFRADRFCREYASLFHGREQA